MTSTPGAHKASASLAREFRRIRWRAEVLSMPNGVDWLLAQCRKLKWKEPKLGPELGFPPGAGVTDGR